MDRDLIDHLKKTNECIEKVEDFSDHCTEWMINKIEKFLIEKKKFSEGQVKNTLIKIVETKMINNLKKISSH